jgi:hypothetical protein
MSAIVEGDGTYGIVYSVQDDDRDTLSRDGIRKVKRQSVRIERMLGDEVAIRSGLNGTQRVVTRGGAYLQDGAWVRLETMRAPTVADTDTTAARPTSSASF